MGKKKAKNKRNSELKIIFFIILVAAALFIVSTYAWFSTQRDVSITNLQGTVEVAEGLEISLDAENWSNDIVLGEGEGKVNIIDNAYSGHRNISPVEMLPVSTLGGKVAGQIDAATALTMIRGKITNSVILSDIVTMNEELAKGAKDTHNSEDPKYPGYFAFDIFLKNSSKNEATADVLQLNYNSSVRITETENANTGLQNTVRVGFARYGATTKGGNGVAGLQDSVTDILTLTGAKNNNVNITDVAIWEPNSGTHVEYIVTNNNKIKWSASDGPKYGTYSEESKLYEFGQNTQIPTYALAGGDNGATKEGTVINNIYDWSGTNSATMAKQVVLQTTNSVDEEGNVDYKIKEGVQNLKSITSTDASAKDFVIAPNSILRMRIYVWLEGQDVDCINWASYGGGVTVDIGLVKGSEIGSKGEAQAD